MGTHEEDFVEHLLSTSTHNTLLFFSNKGKVYKAKGYEVPEFSRTAKGIPIINMLNIEQDEWINAVIAVEDFVDDWYLVFTTRNGITKRTTLSQFANIRKGGLIALGLREDDELISVRLTDGSKDIMIGTRNGYLIRFNEDQIRPMGRTAAGVKGISLRDDDHVVSMEILDDSLQVLTVTTNGYGKRTPASDYRITNRGGKGIITCNLTDKNGHVVSTKAVNGEEDIMIITASGVLIRMPMESISETGRNTQGVRLIRLGDGEEVATVARVESEKEEEELLEEAMEAEAEMQAEQEASETESESGNDPTEES